MINRAVLNDCGGHSDRRDGDLFPSRGRKKVPELSGLGKANSVTTQANIWSIAERRRRNLLLNSVEDIDCVHE
jgi:hypothetical protein